MPIGLQNSGCTVEGVWTIIKKFMLQLNKIPLQRTYIFGPIKLLSITFFSQRPCFEKLFGKSKEVKRKESIFVNSPYSKCSQNCLHTRLIYQIANWNGCGEAKPFRKKLTSEEIKNTCLKTESIQNRIQEAHVTRWRWSRCWPIHKSRDKSIKSTVERTHELWIKSQSRYCNHQIDHSAIEGALVAIRSKSVCWRMFASNVDNPN
jgi:hypothetical protein